MRCPVCKSETLKDDDNSTAQRALTRLGAHVRESHPEFLDLPLKEKANGTDEQEGQSGEAARS